MNNIVKLIIIGALIVAIPVTVKLVQQQQILKSRASDVNCFGPVADNPPCARRVPDQLPCDSYVWRVDPNRACSTKEDCPKNEDQSSAVDPETSRWCYEFATGTNRCLQLRRKDNSPDCSGGGKNCSATIEEARRQLVKAGGPYQNSSCDEVEKAVCSNCGVFVPPNVIRTELCPNTCGGSPAPTATANPISKDTGGSATACNGNVAYPGNGGYALWNGQCSGALQAPGSQGIGQSCCESSICGADPQCDEQTPGQGNCTADCKVKSSTPERRDLCVSTTVSPGTVSAGGQLTVTSTVSEANLRNFRYAFYNRDNGSPPKIICQQGITSVVDAAETARQCPNGGAPLVIDKPAAASATSLATPFSFADLSKPDTNWNSQIPTHFQVNGYFIDQFGLSSLANTNCSKPFDIAAIAPSPSPSVNRMPGDADDNRCVNVDDYTIWKQEAGVGGTKSCANWTSENPSMVDTEDYGIWYRAWKVLTNRQGCITPPVGSRCIDK